jgi:hypothetical protein
LNDPEPNLVQTDRGVSSPGPSVQRGDLVVTGTAPSRRQVVRAGAWTVPAIAVAAAAPAFAASGANLSTSTLGTVTSTGNGAGKVAVIPIRIINTGQAFTENLTVKITVTGGGGGAATATGFSVTYDSLTSTYTFVRTAGQVPGTAGPGDNFIDAVFNVPPGNSSGANSTTVVLSITNGPGKTFPSFNI